jgi:hypothetical protein
MKDWINKKVVLVVKYKEKDFGYTGYITDINDSYLSFQDFTGRNYVFNMNFVVLVKDYAEKAEEN